MGRANLNDLPDQRENPYLNQSPSLTARHFLPSQALPTANLENFKTKDAK